MVYISVKSKNLLLVFDNYGHDLPHDYKDPYFFAWILKPNQK